MSAIEALRTTFINGMSGLPIVKGKLLGICLLVVAVVAALFPLLGGVRSLSDECSASGDDWCVLGIPWYDALLEGILPALGMLLAGGLFSRFWFSVKQEHRLLKIANWLHWAALAILALGTLYTGTLCVAKSCDLGAGLFLFFIVLPLAGIFFGAGLISIIVWWIKDRQENAQ